MFLAIGGSAAILAYLFTETTFYQIYTLDEDGVINFGIKLIGILMAFGYAFGVIMQWIIGCSDKNGIKFGIIFSLIPLLLLVSFNLIFKKLFMQIMS
jgi:hypothetical protein